MQQPQPDHRGPPWRPPPPRRQSPQQAKHLRPLLPPNPRRSIRTASLSPLPHSRPDQCCHPRRLSLPRHLHGVPLWTRLSGRPGRHRYSHAHNLLSRSGSRCRKRRHVKSRRRLQPHRRWPLPFRTFGLFSGCRSLHARFPAPPLFRLPIATCNCRGVRQSRYRTGLSMSWGGCQPGAPPNPRLRSSRPGDRAPFRGCGSHGVRSSSPARCEPNSQRPRSWLRPQHRQNRHCWHRRRRSQLRRSPAP